MPRSDPHTARSHPLGEVAAGFPYPPKGSAMSDARRFKAVHGRVPGADHIRITVNPVTDIGGRPRGHYGGIMNEGTGQGVRHFDIEQAAAEARACIKANQSYLRKNKGE